LALTDERRLMRTAKSCGPGAPMQALSRSDASSIAPATVANKLVHRGEREVSRKPPCREGRSDSALPVVTPVCALRAILCTRGRGCGGHPAFPAPSCWRGSRFKSTTRTQRAARTRSHGYVIARSESDEAIQNRRATLDCFAHARNDERICRYLGRHAREGGHPVRCGFSI
jgi:hypothetical protein